MDKKTKRLLKVAHEPDREPYLIVRDSCRVLRTLASLGEQAKVKREVSRLIVTAESEQHPIRRGDALLLIAHSVQQMDPQLAHLLEGKAIASYLDGTNWRRDYRLRNYVVSINQYDHARALAIAQQINSPRFRRQAMKAIGEPDHAAE